MSKVTTFQELRHKCAELYCPEDWTISLWAEFFGVCFKLHTMNEVDKKQAVSDICKGYGCKESLVNAVVTFQRNNKMIKD